jgi:hypothetical protein
MLLLAAVLSAAACANRYQVRADALDQSMHELTSGGKTSKDDFVRRYGVPTRCEKLQTGEMCKWRTELGESGTGYTVPHGAGPRGRGYAGSSAVYNSVKIADEIRAEFDAAGRFITGAALVQEGENVFTGGTKKP